MKAKRLLLLVMAICLTSGVKAQFYDGPDDIYYYIEDQTSTNDKFVLVFNFDGHKACCWCTLLSYIKDYLKDNPSHYEDKVETTEYDLLYMSDNTYKKKLSGGSYETFSFSTDRNRLIYNRYYSENKHDFKKIYKRVDKSEFRVGRSRTPSGKLYE